MRVNNAYVELVRLKNVLSDDRLNVSKEFYQLITGDIYKILRDYFDLKNLPTMEVLKSDGGYKVVIECDAIRLKPFGVVPR